ncbi:MAG: hypothetical protein N838_07110 [Thiohalocapsa sp. PB-PSB1]|jgi:hypothetical protein|nr:MAG: hypothetical protein N838_23110 [Thiohalocapsa sp. PB-PSB1]QQO53164.1 MAG: hypothetical protein N838_07110 [Thiohalocapsa sp. PB-PSB1]
MNRYGVGVLGVIVLLLAGCASVPVPSVDDSYRPIAGSQTIGLRIIDAREEPDVVGTIGLATMRMSDIDAYAEVLFRNELNRSGVNVSRARAATGAEMDALRVPILVEVELLELHFVSIDALLDAADGGAAAEVRVHELGRGITMSRTFRVSNKMSVAWPDLTKNERIVKDLMEKLATAVVADTEFRAHTLLE